jgi:hypothetical protein
MTIEPDSTKATASPAVAISGLIVILGSPNDSAGNLAAMGQGRVQLGYELYRQFRNQGYRLLLTGGYGSHFNTTDKPHAHHAQQLLCRLGVPLQDFVEFAESQHTLDDAVQAAPIVEKYGTRHLLAVTSDFHLPRARVVFEHIFPDRILEFYGAPYLASCSPEEQERLLAHERRALASLRNKLQLIQHQTP